MNNLVKRSVPKLMEWKAKGDVVDGILARAVPITNKEGKRVIEYLVCNKKTGAVYKFFGTYQINQQLFPSDIGRFIEVIYLGESPDVSRNGNPMKLFQVAVEPEPAKAEKSLNITDEDIPF